MALTQPFFQRRALIVGATWAGRAILETLHEYGDGTLQVVGFVDNDPGKQEAVLTTPGGLRQTAAVDTRRSSLDFPVLGDYHALSDLVAQHRVTTLIPANGLEVNGELLQILMNCLEQGVEIIPMAVLCERLTGRVPVEHDDGNWPLAMIAHYRGTGAVGTIVKRVMDVVLASIGLIFLGLTLPFIALAIYIDSPGPIFYAQERVGRGGRRFRLYKFRSMVPDAEKDKPLWAQHNDCRVTRVGRILRATHVDEFPQFLNILKGEMSVVGPRPERPEFVEQLAKETPFFRLRHAMKPGMAGWGLVKQGYSASKEDALVKLQYDLYYIKHQSLWLDIVILLKTMVNTLTFKGR